MALPGTAGVRPPGTGDPTHSPRLCNCALRPQSQATPGSGVKGVGSPQELGQAAWRPCLSFLICEMADQGHEGGTHTSTWPWVNAEDVPLGVT